jgi:hypothetical protein
LEVDDLYIQVAPNPVTGNNLGLFFNIEDGEYEITFYNVAGQIVYRFEDTRSGGKHYRGLNISANKGFLNKKVATGVYFVTIQQGNKIYTDKFIIIK